MGVSNVEVCVPNLQDKRSSQVTPNLLGWWFWLVGGESKWASWRDASDHAPKSLKLSDQRVISILFFPIHCSVTCSASLEEVQSLPLPHPTYQSWPYDGCGLRMWQGVLWSIPCLFSLPGIQNEENAWSRATARSQGPTNWVKQTSIVASLWDVDVACHHRVT